MLLKDNFIQSYTSCQWSLFIDRIILTYLRNSRPSSNEAFPETAKYQPGVNFTNPLAQSTSVLGHSILHQLQIHQQNRIYVQLLHSMFWALCQKTLKLLA